MLLTAYSIGLGTCWVGAFQEEEVRVIMRIPHGIRPIAMVPVGYPAESPQLRVKRILSQIVHFDEF